MISLKVALEYEKPIGGILSYSGLYSPEWVKPHKLSKLIPIFANHGEKNDVIPI